MQRKAQASMYHSHAALGAQSYFWDLRNLMHRMPPLPQISAAEFERTSSSLNPQFVGLQNRSEGRSLPKNWEVRTEI
jgi:hypothetical protein